MLDAQGDACADLAELLSLADRPKEATEALEQALARYERKGNLVMAQRAQMRLTELRTQRRDERSRRTGALLQARRRDRT